MTPAESLWRAAVGKGLKGADPDTVLVARSGDGLPVGPLYLAAPVPLPALARQGDTVRIVQRLHGTARAEIEGGADGLVLTLAGAATARGPGLPDLAAALDGVALDRVALRVEPAPFAGAAAAAALLALCTDLDPARLDVGLDPLGDAARTGVAPPDAMRAAAQATVRLRVAGLIGPVLRADGRAHHEAGATEAQELAAVLASGVAGLRALEAAGLALDEARGALSFLLVADADLVLTVCKLRALRRLWARVEAACGLDPAPIRLHAETAWRMMARRDPHTNLLRATLAAAGAILGGADGLTVLPFTLTRGAPDAEALRLARNTGLILREEAYLSRVLDPVAGAGAFETLTTQLCGQAWALFQTLEREGGLGAALRSGAWAARLAATRAARQAAIADGRAPLVGVTLHPDAEILPAHAPAADTPPAALPSSRDPEPFEASP